MHRSRIFFFKPDKFLMESLHISNNKDNFVYTEVHSVLSLRWCNLMSDVKIVPTELKTVSLDKLRNK